MLKRLKKLTVGEPRVILYVVFTIIGTFCGGMLLADALINRS